VAKFSRLPLLDDECGKGKQNFRMHVEAFRLVEAWKRRQRPKLFSLYKNEDNNATKIGLCSLGGTLEERTTSTLSSQKEERTPRMHSKWSEKR
jgi:hypothetical protein